MPIALYLLCLNFSNNLNDNMTPCSSLLPGLLVMTKVSRSQPYILPASRMKSVVKQTKIGLVSELRMYDLSDR